jgi:hypothetical protein
LATSPREPISPEALFGQFVEDIALLAAPASRQEEWLDEHHYPVVELALQYYDSYHAFAQRLAENGLLDTQDCRHLDKLEEYMTGLPPYPDDFAWLRTGDEWTQIRALASRTLESLDRHKV